ncbi:MAG: hypothetical protein U0350_29445 [Caldilineaceae bacterium]
MPDQTDENQLAEKRYATLILRLLLDRQGKLLQGELVDVTTGFQGRFVGWQGLGDALRAWLRDQAGVSKDG